MYPIVRREKLADNIILMDIKAPRVAAECLPGQFIIAKTEEVGERIPLTICDYDREKETVTIVVQTIGAGTERMMALKEGDSLEDFVGPLGRPSELCMEENLDETKKKKIVFIAGGLGTAPVYPQVKWLKEHGVDADVIMGFRNKDILFYEEEMKAVALGLMANAGIKGSQGGTALRGSLTRLIKPTDDAAALMEQYGLSMTNADGSMKSLGEVMDMLRDKLGGLTEAEQAQVAAQIFGQEAMSGMLAIINASDSDYAKLTDAISSADGAGYASGPG